MRPLQEKPNGPWHRRVRLLLLIKRGHKNKQCNRNAPVMNATRRGGGGNPRKSQVVTVARDPPPPFLLFDIYF